MTIFCLHQAVFAQLENVAYVANYGGGISSGRNLQTQYTIGDKAASDELAIGQLESVYSGFIPGNFIVLSFGLAKDSAVLVVLYEATNGTDWIDSENWLVAADVDDWFGVDVDPTSRRVSAIALPANNLQNNFPEIIKNLEKLERLDVSDNNLKKFPDVSTMPELTELALEKNDFSFIDIVPNLKVGETGTLTYAPQDPFGKVSSDTVQASSLKMLDGKIPGATSYQWKFDPFKTSDEDFEDLLNQNESRLKIDSVVYSSMGAYKAIATSDLIPGFEIETSRKYVWAKTEVSGTINVDEGPLTTGAEVALFRIKETGAYDSTRVGKSNADGSYDLGEVVLGNFVLKVDPDSEFDGSNQIIQTYYVSQDDWQLADTLEVFEKTEGIDIDILFIPPPQTGSAMISGFVESDLSDERIIDDDGRITSRRKVRKAGCSMRRFKSQGRDKQDEVETEIAYYIETDDEGFFNFENVEDGKYLLNIQFPGVPMDETSDVIFEIGGDRENQVFEVNALITELGIEVDSDEVLFNWKPYIKDVSLYPNPTDAILQLDYRVHRKVDNLIIQLTSLDGRLLSSQEVAHFLGLHHAKVDMTHLSAASYFLTFTDEEGTFKEAIQVGKK
ncbi:MAG: hypothetical protein JXR03_08850 [Cyclobacteriaceae bacterium]